MFLAQNHCNPSIETVTSVIAHSQNKAVRGNRLKPKNNNNNKIFVCVSTEKMKKKINKIDHRNSHQSEIIRNIRVTKMKVTMNSRINALYFHLLCSAMI